jgi:hypothetical protein
MKQIGILATLVVWAVASQAQLWQSMGGGTNHFVRALCADTAEGLLYVAGNFDSAGGVTRYQIATWDGQEWGSLGAGTGDTNCYYGCSPLTSLVKYASPD